MSALEPDAPDPHVFPHIREAIRAWWSHRTGKSPSRGAMGAVRGKGPMVGDIVRVGELLTELGLLSGSKLNHAGEQIVLWAMGLRGRCDDRKVKTAIERVTRRARKLSLVAEGRKVIVTRRDSWPDTEGNEHKSTYCVDIS